MVNFDMLFGTDGIRSVANKFPMEAETIIKVAKLAALRFKKYGNNVIIGKDTRCSGYVFESCCVAGFLSLGMDATLVGPIPTPAVAMLTKSLRAAFGVMISASHNEFCDNGLKFFNNEGLKISREDEIFIEENLNIDLLDHQNSFGKARRLNDASGRYIEFVKKTFPDKLSLKGIRIVLDCANGAAYNLAGKVFWELGADVIVINNNPNGYNINLNCGALSPESLAQKVIETKSDIGIAVDGDGDRVVICDSNGNIIDGDQIIASISRLLLEQNRLYNNTVVITNQSSIMLERFLKDLNIRVVIAEVGDKHVVKSMIDNCANLGGEPSGHVIISDYLNASDALIAALQILWLMVIKNQPIDLLLKNFEQIPKIKKNIKITDKIADSKYLERIEAAKNYLKQNITDKDDEKVIIRKSGTEDLIRITAEGRNFDRINKFVSDICQIINE